ncbi:MAG: hypothetical protein A3H32_16640 [Betaproteobacteria bacterium RIFCSPLOWO2_02_FULL_63_19]|nr:MAG: hypothetical protein A3H32_16640 [Betaproteobacteria bacterium RIFCSPLOWO2_02_FULL_63_19]
MPELTQEAKKGAEESALSRGFTAVFRTLLIATSLFHLWTGVMGPLESWLHRSLALSIYLSLLFLLPFYKKPVTWLALVRVAPLVLASIAIGAYIWVIYDDLPDKLGNLNNFDMAFGGLLIVVVLIAVKRAMGWSLVILALAFLIYTRYGPYFPGIFGHRGLPLAAIVEIIFFNMDGIYGFPIGIMSTFVFLFILFGAFFESIGLTDLLASLARYVAQRVTGGAAVAAVLASAIVGSVSGSAISNVMVTGAFTIPMMRRAGYRPEMAAAIEASASTGGQIMPPVMGIAAFVMAEVIGIPYVQVVVLALVPALLYFLGVGWSVYFAAKRAGIGIDRESAPESLGRIMRSKGFLILPLIAVVLALMTGASLMRVAMVGIVASVLVGLVNPHKRFRLREFLDSLEKGAEVAVSMGAVLAWVGLTVGLIAASGFGSLVAGTLVRSVGENLIAILLITMLISLVLGMGMTTVAVYVTLAITVVPGLVELGVNPYVAHFFAFYFGVLSFVTPPVCIATYAAAGLVGANPTKAGWEGLALTASGFLVPFAAVYQPALMLQGSAVEAVSAIGTAFFGVVALSAGLQGYFFSRAGKWERVALAVAGILLIVPNLAVSAVGACLFAGIGWLQYRSLRRRAVPTN